MRQPLFRTLSDLCSSAFICGFNCFFEDETKSPWLLAFLALLRFATAFNSACAARNIEVPFLESEVIFPLEVWHNHASCIVETPSGDLLVCWFHGSSERTADDIKIEGARKRKGAKQWGARFTMADTPGYPDTNCTMFIEPQGRLWLLWPTILANEWHTALMKYRMSSDYLLEGPPQWEFSDVLHVTPGKPFEEAVLKFCAEKEHLLASLS